MKFIQKIGGAIVLGVMAACVFAVTGTANQTYAAEKKADTPKEKSFSFTANAGDSYTQLVRKAVQMYGIQNKKNIGNARIVAIETKASELAGWPELNEGQVVSFSNSLVKQWVADAMKLSDADVAAWQTYVPYIDFDTRGIGE